MSRILTAIGLATTALYVIALYAVFGHRLPELRAQPLNEVGDVLAGAFGPLAIFWLVLGYFQQGIELRVNTAALQLQAEELRNSVSQQQALVEVARQQFETEREVLKHERDQIARSLLPIFVFEGFGGTHYGTGRSFFNLPIRNVGHTVTNIRFSISGPLEKLEPTERSHWQPDIKISLLFSFIDGLATGCTLSIRYTDIHGLDGIQDFAISADLSGTYPALSTNPYPQRESLTPDGQ